RSAAGAPAGLLAVSTAGEERVQGDPRRPGGLPHTSIRLSALAALLVSGAAAQQFFDDRVEPIISRRCLGCHNDELKDGGVSFMGRDGLIKGGAHGPTIRPGKPEASLLIQAIRQEGELKMPPGAKLSEEDITTMSEWIAQGAVWGS